MLLLALFFISPILIAWLILANYDVIGTGETKNRGVLVSPPRVMENFTLRGMDGSVYSLENMRGKWALIYFDDGKCEGECEQNLYMARQARLSQNEEVKRVSRILVLNGAMSPRLEELMKHHNDLLVISGTVGEISLFQKQFSDSADTNTGEKRYHYLVDPLGNYMMYYHSGFHARDMILDLQHLLKWSQIG